LSSATNELRPLHLDALTYHISLPVNLILPEQ
jgi:hypothetical protein